MTACLARGGEFRAHCGRATAAELLSGDRRSYEDLGHGDGDDETEAWSGNTWRRHCVAKLR